MRSTDSSSRFVQELVLYAASAALSCLVLFAGLRQLDPNRESSKKALQQKKEIAKRLGRPLISTTPYEDVIACDVINPDEIDVEFDSVGGLDEVKQALYELVILPLRRPELFAFGKLLSPQKGVLLYGPPGTGKTMLAKAIAKESGAVFINVRISNLMSKWFGDAQKLVSAVFSLAHKLQPAIIFIDEVDSFLGQRRNTDHEALTNMKTEFMSLWDGFTTDRGYYLMSCIKDVPTLRGDNYTEWRKKVDLAFVCAEVDWVVDTPQPVKPTEPVKEATDNDAAWEKKKRDYAPLEMSYTLENKKWLTANKKCMAFIKNTIEHAIVGSIAECTSVGEYLEKIKSQFTGSSKTYATQLLKQLVTEKYTGGGHGIREHILRMSNMAAKLKPMDADLELKPALLVHLVMASLPNHFDTFIVNYNMSPEKWDIEKTIAMCVQEEERLKTSHGGSLNYVKDNKKRNYNQSNQSSPSKPHGKAPKHYQNLPVDKDTCLHCKKTGHYKKDCPDWLKSIMAKKGIPFDADYAKKRKMH